MPPHYYVAPTPPPSTPSSATKYDQVIRYDEQAMHYPDDVTSGHEYITMTNRSGSPHRGRARSSHREAGVHHHHERSHSQGCDVSTAGTKSRDRDRARSASRQDDKKSSVKRITTYSISASNAKRPKVAHRPRNSQKSVYGTASRPRSRKGLLASVWKKFLSWCQRLLRFLQDSPLVCAGAVAGAAIVGGFGLINLIGLGRSHERVEETNGEDDQAKKPKGLFNRMLSGPSKSGDWWFDEFIGFGGSKGNAFSGLMKIIQLFVNHWYRLSQSMVPRALNILLDIYFLDIGTKKT